MCRSLSILCSIAAALTAAGTWPGSAAAQVERPTTFLVRLPADAELYIDHVRCPLTGTTRTFATTPLDENRKFTYTLRANAVRDGRPVSATRSVTFRGGERVAVDFGDLTSAATDPRPGAEGPRLDLAPVPKYKLPIGPPEVPGTARPQAPRLPKEGWMGQVAVASASEKNGAVEVRLSIPMFRPDKEIEVEVEQEGQKVKVKRLLWHVDSLEAVLRIDDVEVYDRDGRRLSVAEVVQRLRRDTHVPLLTGADKLDPYYFGVLRDDVVVLKLNNPAKVFNAPGARPRAPLPPGAQDVKKPLLPEPVLGPPKKAPLPQTPQDSSALPSGAAPRLTWARMTDTAIEVLDTVPVHLQQTRRVKGPDGTLRDEAFTVIAWRNTVLTLPRQETQVLGVDSGPVAERAAELLRTPVPVLVAMPGQGVDAVYQAAFKPGTPILQPPAHHPAQAAPLPAAPKKAPVVKPRSAGMPRGQVFTLAQQQGAAVDNPFAAVKGAMPDIRLARIDAGGTLYLRDRHQDVQMETHMKKDQTGSYTVMSANLQETIAEVPAGAFKACNPQGQEISPAQLQTRLARESVVLVCYDGQKAEAATLAIARSDTPVLVLSFSSNVIGSVGWYGYGHGAVITPAPAPPAFKTP